MTKAEAHFETAHASKYMLQLCKHFAHKVPAEWTESAGHIDLPLGRCDMDATEGVLVIRCEAKQAADLPRLVKVIEVHLERFAFREPPQLVWLSDGRPNSELIASLRAMPEHKPGEGREAS